MGVEYKIKFHIKDKISLENFLTRLSDLYKEEVSITLEDDGFYFCDNLGDRIIAANIFYRLVEKACIESEVVSVQNL